MKNCIVYVVFFLLAVYIWHEFQGMRHGKFREEGWSAWQKSNGIMDANAILSYKRLLRVPRKTRTYTDEFILDQILNTNIPNSAENKRDATKLYKRLVNKAETDTLERTLTLLAESPQLNFLKETYNTRRFKRRDLLHPLFVLDRIEPRVDRLPNAGDMRQRVQACRSRYIEAARNEARVETATENDADGDHQPRVAQVERVIDAGISHTSDPQNVHDSAVNISLRKTLGRLKWDRAGTAVTSKEIERCFKECRLFIDDHITDDDEKARLNMALDQISQGHYNSSLNDREDQIFAIVWDRSKNPANVATGRVNSIKLGVLNALSDMVDGSDMVCSSGRCGRLVDSLMVVDFDPEIGKIQTVEMVRNEIFQKALAILNECITEAGNSNRPHMNEIHREYTDQLYEAAPRGDAEMEQFKTAKDEFQRNLIARVTLMVDGYRSDLSPKDVENIKQYAIEALK